MYNPTRNITRDSSQPVNGASNTQLAAVEDERAYHSGLDTLVAKKLLHRPEIVVVLEQMSCERMPESVACRAFRYINASNRFTHIREQFRRFVYGDISFGGAATA
jgi:hypothetical protein